MRAVVARRRPLGQSHASLPPRRTTFELGARQQVYDCSNECTNCTVCQSYCRLDSCGGGGGKRRSYATRADLKVVRSFTYDECSTSFTLSCARSMAKHEQNRAESDDNYQATRRLCFGVCVSRLTSSRSIGVVVVEPSLPRADAEKRACDSRWSLWLWPALVRVRLSCLPTG